MFRAPPAKMRRKKSRAAPREREKSISQWPKVPGIYRGREGLRPLEVFPLLGGEAALDGAGAVAKGGGGVWRTPGGP